MNKIVYIIRDRYLDTLNILSRVYNCIVMRKARCICMQIGMRCCSTKYISYRTNMHDKLISIQR